MAPEARIRVLIADDHLAVAEGLQALLSRQPDFDPTEVATDRRTAMRIAVEKSRTSW